MRPEDEALCGAAGWQPVKARMAISGKILNLRKGTRPSAGHWWQGWKDTVRIL
jgi:hypothetical protein